MVGSESPEDKSGMQLDIVSQIYEMINDPSVFKTLSVKLTEFMDDQKSLKKFERALENSGKLLARMETTPDLDISRDIGVLVVGVNKNGRVSHVPPHADAWLGAKFVGNTNGIGWIDTKDDARNIAHILQIEGQKHLPVHSKLKDGIGSGQIENLVVVHQFLLSDTAYSALKELYELTPSETRVCGLLAKGLSLKEAAEEAGVKISTVRGQLKNIFLKVGVKSQSELIRILTQISAASAIQEFSQRNKVTLEPDWKNGLVSVQTRYFQTRYSTRLAYSKFGAPKGRPVIYFHHGMGSRLHTRQMAEAAKKHGLLIYKFDRPGFGNSSLLPHMSIQTIGHVVEDVIDHIGVEKISAIGYGVGARMLLDSLPYTNNRINNVTLYSFERVKHSDATVMDKLARLVRERPSILVNVLKIMKSNLSDKTLRQNAIKFYEDSISDVAILQNSTFVDERIKEDALGGRQNFKGCLFEYENLKAPFPDFNNPAFAIPVKAIFGDDDPFNNYANCEPYLKHLPQCEVLLSKGDGQLHIEHNFDRFLQSAYSASKDCSWLTRIETGSQG